MGVNKMYSRRCLKLDAPLPRVPSQLIRLALNDLEKAEKRDDTRIHMNQWAFKAGATTKCSLCLAGAVMRERCSNFDKFMEEHYEMAPSNFNFEESSALIALNDFRVGLIHGGLANLGINPPSSIKQRRYIRDYHDDAEGFKEDMLAMASELEGAGL